MKNKGLFMFKTTFKNDKKCFGRFDQGVFSRFGRFGLKVG